MERYYNRVRNSLNTKRVFSVDFLLQERSKIGANWVEIDKRIFTLRSIPHGTGTTKRN